MLKTLKRKAIKRKAIKRKSIKRKSRKTKAIKNRKTRGGYTITETEITPDDKTSSKNFFSDMFTSKPKTFSQVIYDETDKKKITDYFNTNKEASATDIRDALFPEMDEKYKENAAYEIQVVTGRAYTGR